MPFPQQQQQPYSAGDGAPSGGMPGAGGERGHREDYTKYPFYNVRRYREYFDVDTTVSTVLVGMSRRGGPGGRFVRCSAGVLGSGSGRCTGSAINVVSAWAMLHHWGEAGALTTGIALQHSMECRAG